MDRRRRHREAGDGGRMSSGGISPVLAVAISAARFLSLSPKPSIDTGSRKATKCAAKKAA
jgi:hypothetical protein